MAKIRHCLPGNLLQALFTFRNIWVTYTMSTLYAYTTVLWTSYRPTCVRWHLQLKKDDFAEAKFYC